MASSDTLRCYAAIFEKPRAWLDEFGIRHVDPPSDVNMAAAEALRFLADHVEAAHHG